MAAARVPGPSGLCSLLLLGEAITSKRSESGDLAFEGNKKPVSEPTRVKTNSLHNCGQLARMLEGLAQRDTTGKIYFAHNAQEGCCPCLDVKLPLMSPTSVEERGSGPPLCAARAWT